MFNEHRPAGVPVDGADNVAHRLLAWVKGLVAQQEVNMDGRCTTSPVCLQPTDMYAAMSR